MDIWTLSLQIFFFPKHFLTLLCPQNPILFSFGSICYSHPESKSLPLIWTLSIKTFEATHPITGSTAHQLGVQNPWLTYTFKFSQAALLHNQKVKDAIKWDMSTWKAFLSPPSPIMVNMKGDLASHHLSSYKSSGRKLNSTRSVTCDGEHPLLACSSRCEDIKRKTLADGKNESAPKKTHSCTHTLNQCIQPQWTAALWYHPVSLLQRRRTRSEKGVHSNPYM